MDGPVNCITDYMTTCKDVNKLICVFNDLSLWLNFMNTQTVIHVSSS